MSPSLRGSVDVSPVLQHRADILSDGLQCTFYHRVDWELDGLGENGPDVVLLSQRDLTKHNPGPEVLVHRTLTWLR